MASNMPVLVKEMDVRVDLGQSVVTRRNTVVAEFEDDPKHRVGDIHPHVYLEFGYGGRLVVGVPNWVRGVDDPRRLRRVKGRYKIVRALVGDEGYTYEARYPCSFGSGNGFERNGDIHVLDRAIASVNPSHVSWISFRAVKPVEEFGYAIEPGEIASLVNFGRVQRWGLDDGVWKPGEEVPLGYTLNGGMMALVGSLGKGEAAVAMFASEPFPGAWWLED